LRSWPAYRFEVADGQATGDAINLQGIARQRVTARHEWLEKVRKLVVTVKRWADELDWATRVVDKKMEDAEIGHRRERPRCRGEALDEGDAS
jgi:hypothetical protein